LNGAAFKGLNELNEVWLNKNPCIDEDFIQPSEIEVLQQTVSKKCGDKKGEKEKTVEPKTTKTTSQTASTKVKEITKVAIKTTQIIPVTPPPIATKTTQLTSVTSSSTAIKTTTQPITATKPPVVDKTKAVIVIVVIVVCAVFLSWIIVIVLILCWKNNDKKSPKILIEIKLLMTRCCKQISKKAEKNSKTVEKGSAQGTPQRLEQEMTENAQVFPNSASKYIYDVHHGQCNE
jgi:hypothetical protein